MLILWVDEQKQGQGFLSKRNASLVKAAAINQYLYELAELSDQ